VDALAATFCDRIAHGRAKTAGYRDRGTSRDAHPIGHGDLDRNTISRPQPQRPATTEPNPGNSEHDPGSHACDSGPHYGPDRLGAG